MRFLRLRKVEGRFRVVFEHLWTADEGWGHSESLPDLQESTSLRSLLVLAGFPWLYTIWRLECLGDNLGSVGNFPIIPSPSVSVQFWYSDSNAVRVTENAPDGIEWRVLQLAIPRILVSWTLSQKSICVCTYVCVCSHTRMHINIYVCVYTYIYMYIHMCT